MSKTRAERSPLHNPAVAAAPASGPSAPVAGDSVALVARQPIYGPATTVMAYELLYGKSPAASGAALDTRHMTLKMVADAALEIGLDRLAGGLPVHINYPRELLVGPTAPSLHAERVVIEVVEEVPNDQELVEGIRALRARGHHIALDDYAAKRNTPALLDLVDIVKINVSQDSPEALARIVPELIRRGLRLIAQDVRTIEQFERCLEIGFEGFQGDFLQRPQTFLQQRVPSSRLATLRLVAALQNEDYSVEEVEQLLSQDVSMSYRVLRCINSSYYNLPRQVDSIRHAVVILGLESLRQLCTLVALQGFDDRPPSLFVTAMARGRMCEQLGRLGGATDAGAYFITGLFSMLDVLTGMPIARLTEELPLAPKVVRALVAEEGDIGAALKCARAYERAAWECSVYGSLSEHMVRAAYLEAVFWAEQAQALIEP